MPARVPAIPTAAVIRAFSSVNSRGHSGSYSTVWQIPAAMAVPIIDAALAHPPRLTDFCHGATLKL